MNSGEPLQGAPALGLDSAVGSAQVENAPALKRRIHEKAFAPSRPLRFVYWAYERWLLRQPNKDRCLVTSASSWTEIAAMHGVEVSATRARSINTEPTSS